MKMKLYKALKWFPLVALSAGLFLLLTAFLLRNVPEELRYTYENGEIVYHSWRYSCEPLFLPSFIVLAILLLASALTWIVAGRKRWETGVKSGLAAIGTLATLVACAFLWIFSYMGVVGWTKDDYFPAYYEFSDQAHTIVIEESSWGLGCFGQVFQIKDDREAVLIMEFGTDDGFRNGGNYQLEWYDDHVDMTFNCGDRSSPHMITKSAYFED